MAADGSLTKHGFPRGYRFVPTPLELVSLLSGQIHGGELLPPHDSIFHNVPILQYHPEELYERYKEDAEHRYIYFFSVRQFQKQQGAAAIPEDKDQKEPRPVRQARGGGWRPSGGGQVLGNKDGFVAGRMVTLVFYDGVRDKSSWGMHEFVVPVDDNLRMSSQPPIPKNTRFYDLALYRLYILKGGDMESDNSGAGSSSQMPANAHDHFLASAVAPCPPAQPCGASTSLMPPLQHHPGVEHAHYYCHNQSAFGAPSSGAAAQQHAYNNMPVPAPPAVANPSGHLLAPATATHGAGKEDGHFGATHSPLPAEQQSTTATTEPAHAEFASDVKPTEEAVAPPLEDTVPAAEGNERVADADDDYNGPGMPDWDLGFALFDKHSFQFTMEEILRDTAFDEPPAMEGDGNSGGGNCSQADGTKQEPPAALGCC